MISLSRLEPILRAELEKTECHPEVITYESDLADLGFDSASVLRVISILEESFELDYEKMESGIWTVADLARMVNS